MKETIDIVYSQVQTAPQHVPGTSFSVQARPLSRKEPDMSFILLTFAGKAVGYGHTKTYTNDQTEQIIPTLAAQLLFQAHVSANASI